jgi:GNAT superfamily N-acetyltransferase
MSSPADHSSPGSLSVTVAGPGELDTVLGILRAASSAHAGPDGPMWGHEFLDVVRDVPAGLVYLARVGGRTAGTFVLRWSDEKVWGPDDGEAGYLHRLATRPGFAGQGLGVRLITAADDLVRRHGRRWLRLDCDRDNARLRGYYESLGFTRVGDFILTPRLTLPGIRAATLYQRALAG